MWSQRGLEVHEHPDGGDLLQPLAAGLLAVLLVLAGIVEARAQRGQQLLGQGAEGSGGRLAEDHVPPQLQRCVWRVEEEEDERTALTCSPPRRTCLDTCSFIALGCIP